MDDHRGFGRALAIYFPFVAGMSWLVLGHAVTLAILAAFACAYVLTCDGRQVA